MIRAKRAKKLARDAHRQRDGDARRETDRLHALDRPDRGDEAHDPLGGHRERIPAADDDVAHLRVGAQPRERGGERVERHRAVAAADHARARAEAAVDRAAIGRQEEDAIGIALDEMRRDLVRAFAERVDEVPRHVVALPRVGNALPAYGARGIVAVDEGQVVRRDADREPLALGAPRPFGLARSQRDRTREVVRRADRVPELPAPILVALARSASVEIGDGTRRERE